MFSFDLTDKCKKELKKLGKKNPALASSIKKKMKEIVARDEKSIQMYKNLRHDLKNLKRVHITEWLVLTFEVDLLEKHVLFVTLDSRDSVYKK